MHFFFGGMTHAALNPRSLLCVRKLSSGEIEMT
jgi:hypothetical protein